MSDKEPLQPPDKLWDALLQIIGKLSNEFLLAMLGILVLITIIGILAPDTIGSLGKEFFYLVVILAWLAYLIVWVLKAWLKVRQARPLAGADRERSVESAGGSTKADHDSTAVQGEGNITIGKAGGNVTIVQAVPPPSPPPPDPADLRDRYLDSLIADCRRARLVGLDPQAADPTRGGLSLERLYVALDTKTTVAEEGKRGTRQRPLSALEALARAEEGRAVLLGLPGAGKSTFVRYLALRLAQALRDPAADLADLLPGWRGRPLIPLIVPLGRLAESLPPEARQGNRAMIERFLADTLDAAQETRGYAERLLATIRREGGLVLFDGLDEVADLKLRPVIRQAIESFADEYGRNGASRFLVTCRTYSYTDPQWQLTGWPTHEIAPLNTEQIERFVKAWHAELARVDPARAPDYKAKRQKMLAALDPADRRRLAEIAPNPLILTVMCVVHTHKGELPDARALVYQECIDLLLIRWEMERAVLGRTTRKRSLLDALDVPRIALDRALQELAYQAHGGREDASSNQPALMTEDLIAGVLRAAFNDSAKVDTFLRYCESANGLVMFQGVAPLPGAPPDAPPRRVYAFPHMTFEEYLAGRYLGRMPNLAQKVREHLDRGDRWREPVMLLGEYLCFSEGDFERMDAILARFVPDKPPPQPTDADWRAAWLAGDLLMLYRRARQGKPNRDSLIVDRLRALITGGALTPRERAAAGRTLAVLGDPRFDPTHAYLPADPLLGFVRIPAGPFLMGSSDEDDMAYGDEKPQHQLYLDEYYIARWPVTVAQWRAFVEESGHEPKDPDSLRDPDNHPVRWVSWYEAVAYCEWLSEKMKKWANGELGNWETGKLGRTAEAQTFWERIATEGWRVMLPSEAEWEKAARGPHSQSTNSQLPNDRRYPWDDKFDPNRANIRETGIGTTSAVGCFPGGASPYGVEDLSGNVWEWTRSLWGKDWDNPEFKYPYNPRDGREKLDDNRHRVVRGGSFNDNLRYARCAVRSRYNPGYRDGYYGLRLVVASPSALSSEPSGL